MNATNPVFETPKFHKHKEFGIVISPTHWKSLIQEQKKSTYIRVKFTQNFGLLARIPKGRPQSSMRKAKVFSSSIICFPKSKAIRVKPLPLKNCFQHSQSSQSVGQNSAGSFDNYKKLAMKHIRNYNDSENEDDNSVRPIINTSIMSNAGDLTRIDEKGTQFSSNNARFFVKFKDKELKVTAKNLNKRKLFSPSKYNIKFK